jgi:hypothetical protein
MTTPIISSGGIIFDENQNHYLNTNSLESIEFNIYIDKVGEHISKKTIQLDVVNILENHAVIAQDNTEKEIYNLNKKFSELSFEEYTKSRIYEKFTPMTFEKLNDIINTVNEKKETTQFLLNIKSNIIEYEKSIKYICKILGNNINYIIFQIYGLKHLDLCKEYGIKKIFFSSTDIIFDKPLSIINDDYFQNIIKTIINDSSIHSMILEGMSIHINYMNNEDIISFLQKYNKLNIYYYGEKYETEHEKLYQIANITNNGMFIYSYTNWLLLRLFQIENELLYLPSYTIYNRNTCLYSELWNDYFKRIFNILNKENIDYFVYGGTLIGFLRNKKNVPFADDYDILIHKDDQQKFEKIIPILKKMV